jgi:phage tail sheath protein FI
MIRSYQTPGVYLEKPRQVERVSPQRTDIVGFVGLAERGPLHTPVRVTNWREFQGTFGGFLSYAHLAYSVRAFFENGGQGCWVVRVANLAAARAASVRIPDAEDRTAYRVEAANTGKWGDGLMVSVQAASLAATHHRPIADAPPDMLAVLSTTGLESGSRVLLTQSVSGSAVQVTANVIRVDAVRGFIHLDANLSKLNRADDDNPISLQSQEFTLLVYQNDQIVERFANLAPNDTHRRAAPAIVNAESQLIRLTRGDSNADPLPLLPWHGTLSGGIDGLRSMTVFDFVGTPQGDLYGLAALASVDEVSLLAIPDLNTNPRKPQPLSRRARVIIDECALDTPTARTTLTGRVLDAETMLPVAGISVSDGLTEVITDDTGSFTLPNRLPGDLELAFNGTGYTEKLMRVSVVTMTEVQTIGDVLLPSLDLPPQLSGDALYYGQAQMIAQCELLRDRFALLDPPLTEGGDPIDLNSVINWRARFETAFAALYYPWLLARDPADIDTLRLIPPCGYVAGVYAATDLAEGVFRPPANRALNFADDVGVKVDDATQGVLNPLGINAIRAFPGRGIRVYGARTLSSDSAWRYVNVRRLMTMIEQTLLSNLQWAVFEPNGATLQLGLRATITTLLDSLWRRGAFAGETPEAAYNVRCDDTTTPPDAAANGQIIAEVAVAPVVPYEFVVVRVGVTLDELQISEV